MVVVEVVVLKRNTTVAVVVVAPVRVCVCCVAQVEAEMMAHIAAAEKKSNILERQLEQVRMLSGGRGHSSMLSVHSICCTRETCCCWAVYRKPQT